MPKPVCLPDEVSGAIRLVAAINDTPPEQLAGMVIADWLAEHHAAFRAAADAIDQLLTGQPAAPGGSPASGTVVITGGPVIAPDDDRHDEDQDDEPQPALADDDQDDEDDPLSCPCGFVAAAPQGLAAHKRHCKALHPSNGGGQRRRCANGCDRIAASRLGNGELCRDCWRLERINQ